MTITAPSLAAEPHPTLHGPRTQVVVLRTSIGSQRQVEHLRAALDDLLAPLGRWTVDLEDRDRVLRIERCALDTDAVISALEPYGVTCAELE